MPFHFYMNCQNNFNGFIFVITTCKMPTFDLNIKCIVEFHLTTQNKLSGNITILMLQMKILGLEEVK